MKNKLTEMFSPPEHTDRVAAHRMRNSLHNVLICAVTTVALTIGCDGRAGEEATTDRAPDQEAAAPAAVEAAEPRRGDPDDWCAGHGLPESMCTICNPELTERFQEAGDWCAEHGLPESACPQCNPMLPPETASRGEHDGHDHPRNAPAAADEGGPRRGDPDDWCAGHGLPESMCTICNPELTDQFQDAGDWCAEHGLPESACPQCNPMLPPDAAPRGEHDGHGHAEGAGHDGTEDGQRRGDPSDWCAPHGLPESMCTICNPELTDQFQEAGDWCAEHGLPESACPQCNPMLPPEGMAPPGPIAPGTRIVFRESSLEDSVGIETVDVASRAIALRLETTARIDFDRNAMADVRSPVPGIVRSLPIDLGTSVEAGDPVATLESAQVGSLQARRSAAIARRDAARANVDRVEELASDGVVSRRELELAQQELAAAAAEIRAIDQSLRISGARRGERGGTFVVTAPITGTVVRRPMLVGSYAAESDSLATIADTRRMWVILDVPARDAPALRRGQRVTIHAEGIDDAELTGELTWIAAEVDPTTRTVKARAEVANTDGLLRAGQFADATVDIEAPHGTATVPADAIQRVDDASVVFVRTAEGVYEPRVVETSRSDGRWVHVRGELHEGEPVVTTGAYLLRTELSRDSIGAGCCEVGTAGGP